MERPTRGRPDPIAASGLHLRPELQKRFMARQCTALTDCLTDALAATATAAPVCENDYIIERLERRANLAHDEARWEEAYQVNLPNKKTREATTGGRSICSASRCSRCR
jgi:hypothetical protein